MDEKGTKDYRRIGLKMRDQLLGEDGKKALERMERHSPRIARWAVENLFGEVYGNEVLDLRTRSLCTLSALIALGHEAAMTNHLRAALRIGIKKEELVELINQMLWYTGVPAASKALRVLDSVMGKVNRS